MLQPIPEVIQSLSARTVDGKKNVIILTLGLSGSSVLTGLISRAGYWTGDETFKKEYDTYENQDLIRLNSELLEAAGYRRDYTSEFSWDAIKQVTSLHGKIDLSPFRQFVTKCEAQSPWIWKDPRLYLTIRFWAKLLDLEQVKFILLIRDQVQAWISQQLRRQICTYGYFQKYDNGLRDSLVRFLEENRASYLVLRYEDLVLRPVDALGQLNRYIERTLTVDDLRAIYKGSLYKKPRSHWDLMKALAIYAKNYTERRR
jgi:hypothetical protein